LKSFDYKETQLTLLIKPSYNQAVWGKLYSYEKRNRTWMNHKLSRIEIVFL